jgi:biotin carboxylase
VYCVLPQLCRVGVELADELSERMGLRTNGTALSEARRNKFVMGETIRAAGIRAVKQLRASTWPEIAAFMDDWRPDPFKVIVKPLDSAGSDDVTLCLNMADVQAAFGNIIGKVNCLGLVNRNLLVQEFLEGQEYVVDMVSRDGVHKVAAIWAYDRRPANGASFVCFGQRLLTAADEHCADLISYMKRVLDALRIRNGPTHGEVKWFKNEPVLVEVGARCHGGDGLWVNMASECFGYNQAEVAMFSYLFPDEFNAIPDLV